MRRLDDKKRSLTQINGHNPFETETELAAHCGVDVFIGLEAHANRVRNVRRYPTGKYVTRGDGVHCRRREKETVQ